LYNEKKNGGVCVSDERVQWHPAFYEAIKQELIDYASELDFQSEVPLTEQPLRIDVLIIKKLSDVQIKKLIAAIFRKHNIVEYKRPRDHITVSDYNKVYGYAYLYASIHNIDIDDITITIVVTVRPVKLMRYLRVKRGYDIKQTADGIYNVKGSEIPVQIIESKRLDKEENLWLRSLSDSLDTAGMEKVLGEREKHADAKLNAYMHALMIANPNATKGVRSMKKQTLKEVIIEMGLFDEIVAERELKGKLEAAKNALDMGLTIEQAAKISRLDVQMIQNELLVHA
jgi:hypothetical protein